MPVVLRTYLIWWGRQSRCRTEGSNVHVKCCAVSPATRAGVAESLACKCVHTAHTWRQRAARTQVQPMLCCDQCTPSRSFTVAPRWLNLKAVKEALFVQVAVTPNMNSPNPESLHHNCCACARCGHLSWPMQTSHMEAGCTSVTACPASTHTHTHTLFLV